MAATAMPLMRAAEPLWTPGPVSEEVQRACASCDAKREEEEEEELFTGGMMGPSDVPVMREADLLFTPGESSEEVQRACSSYQLRRNVDSDAPARKIEWKDGKPVAVPDPTGHGEVSPRHWVDIWLEDGQSVRATRAHRFWIASLGEWLPAASLTEGMTVLLREGSTKRIDRILVVSTTESTPTYNLSVEVTSNYFVSASGVLAHNDSTPLDQPGHRNYVIRDKNGRIKYTGRFGPNETQKSVERRHSKPRFNPTDSEGKVIPEKARFSPENGDVLEVRPGTRTYGEARRMEHEICVKEKTYIGRQEGNYAGNCCRAA